MDDKVLQIIGYTIAALIWLLPRILRAVFKQKSAPEADQTEAAPSAPIQPEEPWRDYEFEGQVVEEPLLPQQEYLRLADTCAALEQQVADAIVENQNYGDVAGLISDTLQTTVGPRLQELSLELQARHASEEPFYFDDSLAYRSELSGLESVILLLRQVSVERRRVGRAERYHVLDRVASAMMRPYSVFARMNGIALSTRRAMAVAGDLPRDTAVILAQQQIAVAALDETQLDRAHLWPLMARDLALDFASGVSGLIEEARAVLGMPRVLPENVVFAGPRAAVASLYHLWLPQLIADVAATCQMGRSYLLALLTAHGDTYRADSANRSHAVMLFSALSGGATETPLAVRVAVVRGVLQRLQVPIEDESIDEDAAQIVAHQQLVTVIDAHGQRVGVDGQTIAAAADRVAERLLLHQFQSLNTTALVQIPGLTPGADESEQLAQIGEHFAAGEPAAGSILTLLRAAAWAVFKNPPLENKINKSLLVSLSEGQNRRRSVIERVEAQTRMSSQDSWRSAAAWKKAVIAGALLAPRPHLDMSARYRGRSRRGAAR